MAHLYEQPCSPLCRTQGVKQSQQCHCLCGKAAVAVELGRVVVQRRLSLDAEVHPQVLRNLFKMYFTAFDSVVVQFGVVSFDRKDEEQTEEQASEERQSAHCTKRK